MTGQIASAHAAVKTITTMIREKLIPLALNMLNANGDEGGLADSDEKALLAGLQHHNDKAFMRSFYMTQMMANFHEKTESEALDLRSSLNAASSAGRSQNRTRVPLV